MRLPLLLSLLLLVNQSIAQSLDWADGKIRLVDGTSAEGKLCYNKTTGVVSFQSDKQSGSYNARTLASFEYHDKHFYSIPYRASTGVVKQFFEVVREYKDFAIICKTDKLSPGSASEITTLYFVQSADVTPYLEVLQREVKWRLFAMNKLQVRILNSTLPKQIMGENFAKVKAFAKERRLLWHVKDSLISILDYYDSLVAQ
jgi:hypothetical protein